MKIIKISQNSDILSSFIEKWESLGLSIYLFERSDTITLSELVVPKKSRKMGIGTQFMEELVEIADKLGKRLLLTPDTSYGGSSEDRLRRFYKRFGLIDNRGRNKDYSISDGMYRNPEDLNENNE
jgi:GNAT superfamily N-acetyltransferase